MNRLRHALISLVVLIGAGCQCSDRPPIEDETSTGLETSSSTLSSDDASSTTVAENDDARFLAGIFHNENGFTPFGGEGPDGGGAILANVEFRPDGTGTMMFESCSQSAGTTTIQWRWTPLPGPWIELTPGAGEDSLRFLAGTDLQSLRATIDDDCVMLFEIDDELYTFDTFRLGRACWVVRCENDVTHVDYCEGETIPACPPP